MSTLLVISTTSECKQNAVSVVNAQCTSSARAATTRCKQWKRRESSMRAQAIAS